MKDTWKKHQSDTVEERIINCRKAISHWNREHHLNSRKAIEKEKANLEAAMSSHIHEENLITDINKRLSDAYKKEEEYWKQKAEPFG